MIHKKNRQMLLRLYTLTKNAVRCFLWHEQVRLEQKWWANEILNKLHQLALFSDYISSCVYTAMDAMDVCIRQASYDILLKRLEQIAWNYCIDDM